MYPTIPNVIRSIFSKVLIAWATAFRGRNRLLGPCLLIVWVTFIDLPNTFGQTAVWNFYGSTNTGSTLFADEYNTNFATAPTVTFGAGVRNMGSVNVLGTFYGQTFANKSTNVATALSGSDYVELSFVPQSGQSFTITNITLEISASSFHPTNSIALFSSLAGYSAANQVGASQSITSLTTTNPVQLIFAGFTNVISSAMTYRLYFYGPAGSNSIYFGSTTDSSVNGITVNGVPEATTGVLLTVGMIALAFVLSCRRKRAGLGSR